MKKRLKMGHGLKAGPWTSGVLVPRRYLDWDIWGKSPGIGSKSTGPKPHWKSHVGIIGMIFQGKCSSLQRNSALEGCWICPVAVSVINGHDSGTEIDWSSLEVPIPDIFEAYFWSLNFREYHKIWPKIWYNMVRLRTSILGSWRSPIDVTFCNYIKHHSWAYSWLDPPYVVSVRWRALWSAVANRGLRREERGFLTLDSFDLKSGSWKSRRHRIFWGCFNGKSGALCFFNGKRIRISVSVPYKKSELLDNYVYRVFSFERWQAWPAPRIWAFHLANQTGRNHGYGLFVKNVVDNLG